MKRLYIYIISVFFLSVANYPQDIDTAKWINYDNTISPFSFDYPSVFIQEFDSDINKLFNGVTFSFVEYPDYYGNNDTINLHLRIYSSFTILFTDKNVNEIADYFDYNILNGVWYDSEALECSWIDTSAEKYDFNDWKGYKNVTPSALYFAEGGALSKGVDDDRYILIKKVDSKYSLYVFIEGFRFEDEGKVLKQICNSIKVKK